MTEKPRELSPVANAILTIAMVVVFAPIMLLGMLWFVGSLIEGAAKYSEEKDRCLRNATNGLEIRECDR